MSSNSSVFVVSEWSAQENKENELWDQLKKIMDLSRKEPGCIRAHATRQITHPGSPGISKYTIVLLQEYANIEAFDKHCAQNYVQDFFKNYIENNNRSIINDWTCRLFQEP